MAVLLHESVCRTRGQDSLTEAIYTKPESAEIPEVAKLTPNSLFRDTSIIYEPRGETCQGTTGFRETDLD